MVVVVEVVVVEVDVDVEVVDGSVVEGTVVVVDVEGVSVVDAVLAPEHAAPARPIKIKGKMRRITEGSSPMAGANPIPDCGPR